MIIIFYGQPGTGKSTAAKKIFHGLGGSRTCILLDGDVCRRMWPDLGFSIEDRYENQKRMASIARSFYDKGYDVVVATVCPTKDMRDIWISQFPPEELAMQELTEVFDKEKNREFKVEYFE